MRYRPEPTPEDSAQRMKTLTLLVLLAVLELGGCEYESAGDNFNRQIELCSVAEKNGILDTAVETCNAALVIAQARMYPQNQISSLLYRLGRLERQRGNFQEAETLVERSLALEETLGDQAGIAIRLVELALNAAGQGRWMDGAQLLERALPSIGALNDEHRKTAANALRGFSARLARMGETPLAERFKTSAEELAQP